MCSVAQSECAVCCGDRPGFTLHVRGEWVVWVSVWGVMGAALAWWWWGAAIAPRVGVWQNALIEPSARVRSTLQLPFLGYFGLLQYLWGGARHTEGIPSSVQYEAFELLRVSSE